MQNVEALTVLLLHSSVSTTVMLVDTMVAKKVLSSGEGAATLLKYADDMQEDAEKVGVGDQIKPLIDFVHSKIEHLQSLSLR